MQAGKNCTQAIPSSVSLVLYDDNKLLAEVCNVSDSDHIEEDKNSTALTLLITLKCSFLSGYGSLYTGDLVLKNIGGTSTLPGISLGRHSSILHLH